MTRVLWLLAATCLAWPASAAASRQDLARARTLYNERQFDGAIEAARQARDSPETADAAAIVLARAHLERYREGVDPSDLAAARSALASVRALGLDVRDRAEFLLALGASLFLEDEFGAASEVLESGLLRANTLDPDLGEAMLDWWGNAVERAAALMPREPRQESFNRLEEGMAQHLALNPASSVAGYWLVVAVRGSGRAERAWNVAVASWVRARLAGEQTATLRADLDRLVRQGIIPDRVQPLPAEQRVQAELDLRAEWEMIKEKWQ